MRNATIADLKDGEEAIVLGTIEAAGPLVAAPDGTFCVYWEKRARLRAEASERGGERFWVVDGDQRVLVSAEELQELAAKGDWTRDVIELASAEIQAVSVELAELKDRLKGRDSPELRRRRKKLAKVATLLCSVKAHARGKVHGKGTLESQAAWIEKNRHLAADGPGKATIEKAVNRLLVVLSPGDPVTVSGRFQMGPMPPGLGSGGGYRDRPTCWIARGAHVVGHESASAEATPPSPEERREWQPPGRAGNPSRSSSQGEVAEETAAFDRAVLFTVTLVMLVGGLLTLLKYC